MANDAKQQRKQQILAHARAIISEQGAAALHMKELAIFAEVPRASLYRTYSSKEHIISDITLEWGVSLVSRLQANSPRGKTNGARIKSVFKSILREADDNPLLIGAVLDNLLSADAATQNMQMEFENLLPALLSSAIEYDGIPDSQNIMDVLLRLLLANLQLLSAGRSTLKEALANMIYTSEKLMGKEYWESAC